MNFFNKVKCNNDSTTRYDYMEKIIEIFKVYLAFVNFVDMVCPNTNRQVWTREEFTQSQRETHSLYNQLIDLIKQRNNREFRKFTRINIATYERLLKLLKKKLIKHSLRKPIPAECRLLITLIYLAYDTPRPLLSMAFRLGISTLRNIIMETCECISKELSPTYLKSMTEDDYFELTEEFLETTGLPNCVGALDAIQFVTERKTRDPLVLFGSCNTKYQIINADVGLIHEVMDNDNFVKELMHGESTALPDDLQMVDSGLMLPSYVVTPSTFPLLKHTMRPYPGKILNEEKLSFNDRLKKCSNYLDNAFGVLLYKWRVLQNKFTCLPDAACDIVRSCVILHNFAIEHDRSYFFVQLVDHIDETTNEFRRAVWRASITLPKSKIYNNYQPNAKNEGFIYRDILKDYLYKENV